jgi:hypothetical protein
MHEVLNTINHTTVEALGFKLVSNYNNQELFKLENIAVTIKDTGEYAVFVDDSPVTAKTVDDLIDMVKGV